jgi:hypothetical protein
MKNTIQNGELKELIGQNGGFCASLILPVHGIPSEKQVDRLEIERAVNKLKEQLEQINHPKSSILEKIKELKEQAQSIQGGNAVGIFVSDSVSKIVSFPFEVKEKIMIKEHFEIRDLVQKERYTQDYYTLLLSGQRTRLFIASEHNFREINDQNFPASFDGVDYEIPAPENQGNNASQPLKREKAITTHSVEAFYKTVDEKLNGYLSNGTVLMVAGVEKELANYTNRTIHNGRIKGKIHGSYEDNTLGQMQNLAWQAMQSYFKTEELELLNRLKEMGREFVSSGIRDVWFDARQGKGNILLIEKDYTQKGYLGNDGFILQLEPTAEGKKPVEDAVDDIVRTILEKNGRVVFVDNGSLSEHARIAMMNRY